MGDDPGLLKNPTLILGLTQNPGMDAVQAVFVEQWITIAQHAMVAEQLV
jgi:hypothetical protein